METIRIGVIGAGHMGKNHVRNLAEDKRFSFIGIYDANLEVAKEVSSMYGGGVFYKIEDLLQEVDAVVVAVPSSLHKEIGLKVANSNVHALIEKPLALNSVDAKELKDAFENKNLKLAVGHIERFNPVYKELCKIVKNEDIFYIEAFRYSPFSGSGRITDTSVIEDLMIHDVDLVCNLMNEIPITNVIGMGNKVLSNRTDFATGILDFDAKAHAVINASRVSQNKERVINIHTSDSHICANLLERTLNIYKNTDMTVTLENSTTYKQNGVVQKIFVPIEEPLKAELKAFYHYVIDGVPLVADGSVGVRAIEICEEIAKQIH